MKLNKAFQKPIHPAESASGPEKNYPISKKKKVNSSIDSVELYRKIVETANEAIILADPAGCITLINNKMAEMLGYTVNELTGKRGIDLIAPDLPNWLSEMSDSLKSGKRKLEYRQRTKNGDYRRLSNYFTDASDSKGKPRFRQGWSQTLY